VEALRLAYQERRSDERAHRIPHQVGSRLRARIPTTLNQRSPFGHYARFRQTGKRLSKAVGRVGAPSGRSATVGGVLVHPLEEEGTRGCAQGQ
jgi:hypothetical protein